jgi:hypothetical protein
MTAENTFALEVAKYASRNVYGIIKVRTDEDEMLRLLNKQMIMQVLGDPMCLEELTTEEEDSLTGVITLNSEFYG